MADLQEQINELLGQVRGLNERIDESQKTGDTARKAAADVGIAELGKQLTAIQSSINEDLTKAAQEAAKEAVKAALLEVRGPSMAGAIGTGSGSSAGGSRMIHGGQMEPHPALKASFRDYQAGEFLTAMLDAKGMLMGGLDIEQIQRGKASLDDLGVVWAGQPQQSKAVLGATGATGGYTLPNNLVDSVVKPNVAEAIYTDLMTVRNGVNVRGVDQPYRTGAPTRMVFQDWGATKENVNLAYGSYTASLGTLARIIDIGKQYARFSGAAAEADVVDELSKAARLGENFYALAGAGTGSVGSGDPTLGVYTGLTAAGVTSYTTAFAGAANNTIAGSAASGIIAALKALATRARTPSALVTDAVTYWQMFSQGSDSAGFWMSEMLGAGFTVGPNNTLGFRGTPIVYDPNFDTNTSSTKRAILADWKAFKFYRGLEFRIDTSDVANTRWDQNLIGFRGEEEIGINAYPGIFTGNAQLITGLIP